MYELAPKNCSHNPVALIIEVGLQHIESILLIYHVL